MSLCPFTYTKVVVFFNLCINGKTLIRLDNASITAGVLLESGTVYLSRAPFSNSFLLLF